MYSDNLIPSIRSALSDPLPEVRRAAASTFSVLHSTIGPQAMDDVLTPLLALLVRIRDNMFRFSLLMFSFSGGRKDWKFRFGRFTTSYGAEKSRCLAVYGS